MRVLVAGATGAVGRPLVRLLSERGHEVAGTTRNPDRTPTIRELGAEPLVCDALDPDAVHQAVHSWRPEVIVNQLTALSAQLNPRRYLQWLEPTNRLRAEGTRNLANAGAAAGTRVLVSQSIMGFGPTVAALRALEQRTLTASDLDGIVMRYGYFYGPRTSNARDGQVAENVRRRRFPVVGSGAGRFSFIHVDDAAAATVAALEHGSRGTFNVVDDEPAETRVWLPYYAEVLGAKSPRRVPLWLARVATSRFLAEATVRQRGAANARIKRELGWAPRWPSWRQGFREALG